MRFTAFTEFIKALIRRLQGLGSTRVQGKGFRVGEDLGWSRVEVLVSKGVFRFQGLRFGHLGFGVEGGGRFQGLREAHVRRPCKRIETRVTGSIYRQAHGVRNAGILRRLNKC